MLVIVQGDLKEAGPDIESLGGPMSRCGNGSGRDGGTDQSLGDELPALVLGNQPEAERQSRTGELKTSAAWKTTCYSSRSVRTEQFDLLGGLCGGDWSICC